MASSLAVSAVLMSRPRLAGTPAQQLPRSRQNLEGAGRQLMTIGAGDVGPVVGVLLDPPAVDQPDEGPAEI